MQLRSFCGESNLKGVQEVIKLSAIAIGMAITISCNTILVSLLSFATGSQLILAIAIAGACMAVIALCFSELSSKFPGAIGIRAFTRVAFGNQFSLAISLFYVLMVTLIGGLEVYLCHLLLEQLLPRSLAFILLIGLVLSVLYINLRGYELSLRLQIGMTISVASMMLLLSGMALYTPHIPLAITQAVSDNVPNTVDLMNAIPRALFLFIGIEWAIMHVTRHQSFKRIVPLALLFAVLTIAGLYANFGMALEQRLNLHTLSGDLLPHLSLARALKSEAAKILVIFISLLAVLSSFNVGLSGAARILYSLARERELPAWFAQLDGEKFIPRNAMLAIAATVLLFAPLMSMPSISNCLSQLLSFHLSLVYTCVLFAWLQLRRRKDPRGIKQAVHPALVFPCAIFLICISLGVLFDPANQFMRWIVFIEIAALSSVCLYLFRLHFKRVEG